jgi:HEAT repeat protein
LAASKSRLQRAELVSVLGAVRDRRALGPLLERTRDEAVAVRANAAEALAAYADPPDAALLSGVAAVSEDAIVARWIELLDDPEAGPRASAMKALTSLPPREDVRRALAAHDAATHPENAFGDYELAQAVVTLLQTGEGQDALLAVLAEKDLFRRRFVWELLRPALRLEPRAFDPAVDPGTPRWKALDPEVVRAAVRARRSGP